MVTNRAQAAPGALGGHPATADQPWVIQLRRARTRRRVLEWALRLLVAAVILVSWQIVGQRNPLFTSYPTAVAQAAWNEITTGVLFPAIGQSFETLALGLLLAVVVGVGVGLAVGRYALVESSIGWLISALNSTPLLALIPLIIVWFGLGIESKVFTVFSLTVFSMIFNTAAGVQAVERNILDVGQAFVASEGQVFRKIILPSSVPFIMTGLRISIGRALIGTVAAEFFTGIGGLGGLIQKYGASYSTNYMLVPVLTLMLIGVILTALARWLETAAAPWRERKQ
jgi:ABC-type nitrate/sulfonate/bicarbonate transport system permease component